VDGRGRQQLVRSPDNGGVAIVQIEDKDGGAEGYTFDITWGAGGSIQDMRGPVNQPTYQDQRGSANQPGYQDRNQRPPVNQPGYQDRNQRGGNDYPGAGGSRYDEQYRPNYRDSEYYKRYGHAFGVDEAVRTCQQAVLRQVSQRFRNADVHFHRTAIDDTPGRQDWVTGTLDVHRGQREERFGFSCSVNFDSGRVRSAEVDPRPLSDDPRWH
jgi:hypothetical protein